MQILKERILVFGTIVVFLCMVQWITTNNIFFYMAMIVLLGLLLFDNNDILILYFMLLPSIMTLKSVGNSSAWLGYFGILFSLKLLITERKRFVSKKIFISVLIHIISIFVSVLLTGEIEYFSELIRFISLIIMISSIKSDINVYDSNYIDKLLFSYIYGTFLNCLIGMIYYSIRNYNLFNGFFAGINNDRNYFAIQVSSACILYILYLFKNEKLKLNDGLILFTILGIGLLSGSRTYLILVVFIILLFMITLKKFSINNIIISVIPLIILTMYIVFNFRIGDSIYSILERFADNDVSTGNGRFDVWNFYIDQVMASSKTFLFGVGKSSKALELGYVNQAEHNSIVQALYQFGIMGLFTFSFLMFNLFEYLRKGLKYKIPLTYFLGFLGILFGYSTISSFYSDNFNAVIILFIILICKKDKLERKYRENCSN